MDIKDKVNEIFDNCVPTISKPAIGVGLLVVGGSGLYYTWNYLHCLNIKKQLAQKIEHRKAQVQIQKQALRKEALETDDRLRNEIVTLSAEALLQEIRVEKFTVQQVLKAYRAEAYRADLETNCVVEFIDEAKIQAQVLDGLEEKGPLHGLPISVKETYNLKDYDCTSGLAKLIGIPCKNDAVVINVLKKLGAVPFVRTNIVQTTCSYGSANPIYGETVNPHNKFRVPGGSSSGEGALIGYGGSIIGLGTDVGGSVRIPAAMCGIYSLKPTQQRLSGLGIKPSLDGIAGVYDCPGLMAREVEVLVTVFRALVTPTMFTEDPLVLPVPFQENVFKLNRSLRIGYYESDGLVIPSPGCQRAVREAKVALQEMGHDLIGFTIPKVETAFNLAWSLIAADGSMTIDKMLENEPYIASVLSSSVSFLNRIRNVCTGNKAKKQLTSTTERSAYELWRLLAERKKYVQEFIEYWQRLQLDAVIAPGFGIPACHSEYVIPLGDSVFVTMLYNMLNFPVGAVPVTKENKEDQKALENLPEDNSFNRNMKEALKGGVGLPLGVQVIGLPWQEEMVLRVMKDLDLGLKTK